MEKDNMLSVERVKELLNDPKISDEEAEKIVTFQHVIEYIKANAPDAS